MQAMNQNWLPPNTLGRTTFLSHIRALAAVSRRQWLIFLRYPTWFLALLVWPTLFPMLYIYSARALAGPDGSGLEIFQQAAQTDNYLGFIVVGTTVWMWQNIVLWNVGLTLYEEQKRGTLESNWLSPAWRFSFLLGSSFVEMVSMLAFLIISGIEFALFFNLDLNGSPLMIALVILAAIPSIYGLGFAFASLVITAKEVNAFVFLVRGMVMIFCGITFPVAILPNWMQSVARYLPQTYIIHAFRSAALNGAGLPELLPDLQAMLGFGLLWVVLGYVLFLRMDRRAHRTGSLGTY